MYKLIVVEDNKWERSGLSGFLDWKCLGITVAGWAGSGIEGEALARKERPDIILTDIVMPELDGIQMSINIRKFLPHCKIIIISGYDNFSYARQSFEFSAFAYLLKPVSQDSLLKTILRAIEAIKQDRSQAEDVAILEREMAEYLQRNDAHMLLDFLESKIELESIINYLKKTGLNLNSKKAIVIYSLLSKEKVNGDCDPISLKQELLAAAADSTADRDILTVIDESRNEVVQCLNAEAGNIELQAHIADFIEKLQALTGLEVIAGIGEAVDVFISLPQSYAQAREALGFSGFAENGEIINYREMHIRQRDADTEAQLLLQTRIIVDELMHNIYKGKTSYGILLIEKFLHALKTRQYLSRNILSSLIIELHRAFGKILADDHDQNRQLVNSTDFYKTLKFNSFSQTRQYIVNLISQFADERIEDSYHAEIVRKVLVIIETSYCRNLDLKSISDEIYLSPYYIGSIFKKFTGKKFTQYLNEYRLRKAKKLLHESDLRINELAVAVGINNPSYFTELFKQMYGLSPAAYKDLIRGFPQSV